MRFQRAYLIGFALHFFLLVTVASRDFFAVLADGSSYLPAALEPRWRVLEDATFTVLGQKLPPNNPMREAIAFYLHAAGIEAGYGYFAPNVPYSYKLVFQLTYPNGTTEYELPSVATTETGRRLPTLLDFIAANRYEPLRQLILKMLAYSVWQHHRDALRIRAVFGMVITPSIAGYTRGDEPSYAVVCAYDFGFTSDKTERSPP
jgi:hypothetical protein